jgi:hypothetical protein
VLTLTKERLATLGDDRGYHWSEVVNLWCVNSPNAFHLADHLSESLSMLGCKDGLQGSLGEQSTLCSAVGLDVGIVREFALCK